MRRSLPPLLACAIILGLCVTAHAADVPAVKLDDKLRFRAAEVRDVGTDRMLAPESRSVEPTITQPRPHIPLDISL